MSEWESGYDTLDPDSAERWMPGTDTYRERLEQDAARIAGQFIRRFGAEPRQAHRPEPEKPRTGLEGVSAERLWEMHAEIRRAEAAADPED